MAVVILNVHDCQVFHVHEGNHLHNYEIDILTYGLTHDAIFFLISYSNSRKVITLGPIKHINTKDKTRCLPSCLLYTSRCV